MFPIDPAGHRVIIKPDPLTDLEAKEMQRFQSLSSAGFELADPRDKKRKESAVHTGRLIKVGPTAWKGFDDGEPWAKEGDHVYFAKYGGYEIEHDGEKYRVMNDEDVTAIIRGDL